jgi:rsbT co-antagonist protein RsbR
MTTTLHEDPGPFFALTATPLAILSEEGKILRANPAFDASVCSEGKAATGGMLLELLDPADRERARQTLAKLSSEPSGGFDAAPVAGKQAGRSLRFHTTKSGGSVLLTAVPAPQMAAGDELKLAIFDRILKSGPVGYWATDENGIYTMNDGKAGEKLGIMPGGLVGVDSRTLFTDGDAYQLNERAQAGEEIYTTTSVPGLDCELWYLPIKDASGKKTGVVGFCIDVTARMQAERDLRDKLAVIQRQKATLEMFGRVLSSAPLLMWSVDPTGTVTMLEGKGTELIGLRPGETVGTNALETYKDSPDIAGGIVRALGGEESRLLTTPLPGVHFDAWFMPLRGENQKLEGAIGLCIDASERVRSERELRDKLELIGRQSATIRALATPIIRIWDEVLCLPVIGTVDSARTADMMHALLEAIVRDQARYAIVDLTGVEVVDTSTADHLIQLFKAAKVLGVDGVLCGIRPAVAQTVVTLGLDLGSVKTMRTLRDALKWCIRSGGIAHTARVGGQVAPQLQSGSPANSNGAGAGHHGNSFARLASGGEP